MNPSALEICAAIALWTIMPSVIAHDRTRFDLLAFSVAGALLILTRAIGPVLYVLIIALSYVATKQRRPLVVIAQQFRNALALHGVAVLFAGWWYLKIYSFQTIAKKRNKYRSKCRRSNSSSIKKGLYK